MEKRNNSFEQAWQNAFQDAEATPSPLLWERIEGRMAMYENSQMRGRLLFYRVAATVLLLLLAGIGLYVSTYDAPADYQTAAAVRPERHQTEPLLQVPGGSLAEENAPMTEEPVTEAPSSATSGSLYSAQHEGGGATHAGATLAGATLAGATLAGATLAGATLAGATIARADSPPSVVSGKHHTTGTTLKGPALLATTVANTDAQVNAMAPDLLTDTVSSPTGTLLASALPDADEVLQSGRMPRVWLLPVVLPEPHLPVRVPVYELARPQQKQWWETLPTEEQPRSAEPVWYAKINVGSHFFDPRLRLSGLAASDAAFGTFRQDNMNTIASADTAFIFAAGQMGERHSLRPALSYGISGGKYLNEHWLLEGGIQYAPGRTYSYTNWVHTDFRTWSATPLTWANGAQVPGLNAAWPGNAIATSQVGYVERQSLITSFDFVSVPLRAGYSVRWENVHLTFKAGMDSDWFLAGRVRPINSRLESVTIQPGATAPYRSWLLSGALGNEVSYQLSDRHSLSLEAAYRFSLHSFTKEDALFNSQPMAYNVGMNFRYFFSK